MNVFQLPVAASQIVLKLRGLKLQNLYIIISHGVCGSGDWEVSLVACGLGSVLQWLEPEQLRLEHPVLSRQQALCVVSRPLHVVSWCGLASTVA